MTFLNSIILYGIALASIPILIHFFTRKKKETIHFSSLRFLKILESKKIKKLKLQQIILLILRTLIILLIVIAFSRPALKETSPAQLGSHIKTSAVIILDNSLSSAAGKGNEQFFDKIKTASAEIINSFEENDQLYFTVTSEAKKLKSMNPVLDKNKSLISIKDSKPTYLSANISKIIEDAEDVLANSKNYNREIYICSDLQNGSLKNTDRTPSKKNEQVKKFIITDSQFKKDNISIGDIKIRNQILKKNKEIDIESVISNYSDKAVSELLVNLYLDGRRTAQKTINLKRRTSGSVKFSVIPEKYGFISGFVEIETDLLDEDNKRYFDFTIPEKIDVLIVSGKDDSENFIKLALNPENSDSSLIGITTINPSSFSTSETGNYDVIILDNVKNIPDSEMYKLKNFLNNGRGLIIFPGGETDAGYYNRLISEELLLPKILSVNDVPDPKKGFVSFGRIEFGHPIFSGMFEEVKNTVDSPHFYKFFTLEKKTEFNVIIELSNGNPFLCESYFNSGRIMTFASSPDAAWSDFPFKGIFVPIINQAVYYLSNETYLQKNSLLIGDEISFSTRYNADKFLIKKPDGSEEKPDIKIRSDNYIIKFDDTELPGIYELFADEKLIKIFSVNIDPKESDLFKPDEKDLKAAADKVIYFDKEKNTAEIIRQSRLGREIGKFLLIGALVLLGMEMWIVKDKNSEER